MKKADKGKYFNLENRFHQKIQNPQKTIQKSVLIIDKNR